MRLARKKALLAGHRQRVKGRGQCVDFVLTKGFSALPASAFEKIVPKIAMIEADLLFWLGWTLS